jgi:hypothetical protein
MNEQDVPQWLRAAFEEQARRTTELADQHARQIQELAAQNASTMATLASRIDAYEERIRTTPGPTPNRMPSPPLQQVPLESVVRRPRPSLPNPDQFDGKNQALFPQFEGILRAKLNIDGRTIGGENEQVWYAFGRLSGEAAGRIYPWMTHAQRTNTLSVDGFFEQIRLAFSDPRSRQKALAQLNRTKQGSRSLNEFLNEFNRLILEAEGWGWDDVIKKGYLKAAISLKLLQATVSLREEETYEAYCSQLRMVSDQLAEIKDLTSRRTAWKKEGPSSLSKETAPETMDWEPSTVVAATRTKRKEPKWASPEEIERRREKGLCLRCGGEGHIVRRCEATLTSTKKDEKVTAVKKDVKVSAVKRKAEDDVRSSDSEDLEDVEGSGKE